MIEPAEPPPGDPPAAPDPSPERLEPLLLEDLVALVRLPTLFRRIAAVIDRALLHFDLPADSPFTLERMQPGDGVSEYGLSWRDPDGRLRLFLGMSWQEQGQDPAWEVRVEASAPAIARRLHAARWPQLCARRAESRFTEWDRFWHEEDPKSRTLLGASAAATRFLEDEEPESSAAEYLGGALYALHASGALHALREAAADASFGGGATGASGAGAP